jgi:hypothetical protein
MDKDNVVVSCLGILVSLILLISVGTFLSGWALSTVWNWFVPSVFNVTALTIWQAVGISMVFELFTGTNRLQKSSSNNSGKSYTDVLLESLLQAVLTPVLTVSVAWIVYQFAF